MTKKDHRFWNIAGVIIIILFVALEAFSLGRAFGSKNEQKAIDSLNHALEVIDVVDVENVDDVCESFDTVMDDIHDALAWMEKG